MEADATQRTSVWPDTAVCNSQRCRQKTSTNSCDLPTDVLRRAQTHVPATPPGAAPGHRCAPFSPSSSRAGGAWAPQAACTQPGTGSPSLRPHVGFRARKLCLGGEEQEAVTLRQVTPFLTVFLFRQRPCGQEVGFPETSAGELIIAGWERLDSHIALRKSPPPPKEHHCLQGFITAANLLQTGVHLTQQSISHSGQWQLGKIRKKAIIYDAAPNIAADSVFYS